MTAERIDVHQHLWPEELLEALRRRSAAPRISGWTLHLDGEPEHRIDPAGHDVAARAVLESGTALALVSLSSPLGIEDLPAAEAAPLLDAWHTGAARLPAPFGAWASVHRDEPDLADLKHRFDQGFAGLQVPATWLATPASLEWLAPVLAVCEEADRPVFVHPGPVSGHPSGSSLSPPASVPNWWPALVDYPAQLAAAWFSWQITGRRLLPGLRIGLAAGAGLAPLQHERFAARAGTAGPVDRNVFVETSSHGPQAVDALIRALGIDVLVLGSDRPYAEPAALGAAHFCLGGAAARAVEFVNPHRFLRGGHP